MSPHLELLYELSGRGPFRDSARIATRANERYKRIALAADSIMENSSRQHRLSKTLERLSDNQTFFLFRTAAVRVWLDQIACILSDEKHDPAKWAIAQNAYDELDKLFEDIGNNLFSEKAEIDSFVAAGFDFQGTLTEPFPYIVNIWCNPEQELHGQAHWSEAESVRHLFHELIPSAGAEPCVLRPMSDSQKSSIESAIQFFATLCPTIAADVAVNVRHICLMDVENWQEISDNEYRMMGQSMSRHQLPSSIFLSLHAFRSETELRESLYHETLHRKLGNLLYSESILHPQYSAAESSRFICPWNKAIAWNRNSWSFDRALDAFHVYVHLHTYYGALIESAAFADKELALAKRRKAYERAQQIREWLVGHQATHMGVQGMSFLDNMISALESSRYVDAPEHAS
jgi:hypothetical protein